MIYTHITELIGNTPLLKIDPAVHQLKNIDLYAKLENMNPFGSVKDRIAWGMLQDDITRLSQEKIKVLESSSGNTAKALQAIAGIFGIQFKTITNRIKVPEMKDMLKIMGAEIEELPGRSDCHDPNDPTDPVIMMQKEAAADPEHIFMTQQYLNKKNIDTHYATTGEEIAGDLPRVDYFFAGLGTAGSSRGVATRLKEMNPELKTIGMIAAKHDHVAGIRNADEMWEVGLFEPNFYHEIFPVTSQDAVEGVLELIRGSGILAGPTAGAVYRGTLAYLRSLDATLTEKKVAVFIVCDRTEPYISYIKARKPDLFGEKVKEGSFAAFDKSLLSGEEVSVVEAASFIENEHPLLIDTRSPIAFSVANIPQSINIPQTVLESLFDGGKPFPIDRPIMFICPLGDQSRLYAAYVSHLGYRGVSLQGGITAWRNVGGILQRNF